MSIQTIVEAAVKVGQSQETTRREAVNSLMDLIEDKKPGISDDTMDELVELAEGLTRHVSDRTRFMQLTVRFQQVAELRLQ